MTEGRKGGSSRGSSAAAVYARMLSLQLSHAAAAAAAVQEQAALVVAKYTRGFSGAQLANVVNEAALLSGRKNAKVSLCLTIQFYRQSLHTICQ